MAKKIEKNTDFWVADLLKEAGIREFLSSQGSYIVEIDNALKTASKKKNGKVGKPEFVGVVKDFLIVIEDKADVSNHIKRNEKELICETSQNTQDYAVNGALHYGKHLAKHTNYKKILAFGVSGNEKRHRITPLFINEREEYKELEDVQNFISFSQENIQDYYKQSVLGEKSTEQIELEQIVPKAKDLHEDLWKYGALRDSQKPLVVSAILLALEDENFSIDHLIANNVETDGVKIYKALENYLKKAKVEPEDKRNAILYNFSFIQNSKELNTKNKELDKTPLKYFTEKISNNIKSDITYKNSEDILGRFYSEFVKYGGGDGQTLGIVLTPNHITDLFCELVELNSDDIVFDPCCGTAGYLISAMHYMAKQVKDEEKLNHIKGEQLYGIEIKDDLFTIATTNMILRGDGKSKLRRLNFLEQDEEELKKIGVTVGLMNPPYSQAKNDKTRHLSELNFIEKLLNITKTNGRVAVIIPQSTMVGKNKTDKEIKESIYKKHTLEGVITLNKNTFYGVGTNPCIAVFTTGVPHPKNKRVKFINFENDGYEVQKHIGLVATPYAKDKKQHLLDVWFDRQDAETKFCVKTTIEPDDEWLHSFYYFNDEIPTEADFEKVIADYLTFEVNMITHGRGYLFNPKNEENE